MPGFLLAALSQVPRARRNDGRGRFEAQTLRCWYLLGTEDKAIPPALQRFISERADATIVVVAASHVSFVSQPDAATQLILQAVEATMPAPGRT
jgi:pimeloyl-ACP methyl ester carboxylesterase